MTLAAAPIAPAWLPSMMVVSPWTDTTFDTLYALFRHDFLDSPANYCSHPVWCFKDMDRGKQTIFWHLTERDDKVLGLPFTHNYFHPELAEASANPAHIICKQA